MYDITTYATYFPLRDEHMRDLNYNFSVILGGRLGCVYVSQIKRVFRKESDSSPVKEYRDYIFNKLI